MYTEDDLLPLSALQHLIYCERQCALIHIEGLWAENRFTAEGRIGHERVHEAASESRPGIRTGFAVPLRSLVLGLSGIADVVEFHLTENGGWVPFPVEHKRGRPKVLPCDKIQLCAQAICLEEMLAVSIMNGAIFYGKTRRRQDVLFDDDLRSQTITAAKRLHDLVDSGVTPEGVYGPKCDDCSMLGLCLPKISGNRKSAAKFLERAISGALE